MDLNGFLLNPCANYSLGSSFPSKRKASEEEYILGIDEAGRGPVLGPMVYAAAYFPKSKQKELREMAFADSKTLTEEKREKIFELVETSSLPEFRWVAEILSPNCISNSMFMRSKYNLNALSHDTAIGLLQRVLDANVNVTHVYVDTVGPPEKYQDKLERLFPGIKFTVAKKADSKYPIVSAASVCAKVIRDRCVNGWKFLENDEVLKSVEWGSGYPGDPSTKAFLRKVLDPVFGFPTLVRFSWQTAQTLLEQNAHECTWEESDEETDETLATPSIKDFFATKPKKPEINGTKVTQKIDLSLFGSNLEPVSKLNQIL